MRLFLIFSISLIACSFLKGENLTIDNENNDESLVVFIAGLGGAKTWNSLISILKNDHSLNEYDAYVFDSLKVEGNIEETSKSLNRTLNSESFSKYTKLYIVAHSIGGIIVKDLILEQAEHPSSSNSRIKHILFIGTPHIGVGFTPPPVKKIAASIFYFALSDLAKEAFRSEKIQAINNAWIEKIETNHERRISNLVLFGNADKVVEAENLHDIFVGNFVILKGDHAAIARSNNEFDCTYQIMKRSILAPGTSVSDLGCDVGANAHED